MIINVKVKPNAKEEIVQKIDNFNYQISIKEPAENQRANKRIINILSREFNVSFKNIRIKNPSSRKKIVEIT